MHLKPIKLYACVFVAVFPTFMSLILPTRPLLYAGITLPVLLAALLIMLWPTKS